MMQRHYSSEWYSIFVDSISPEQTEAEVAFIARNIPLDAHSTILDVCCGSGRHANGLARRGYRVLGVDINAAALDRARAAAPVGSAFQALDMRQLDTLTDQFDAVINLWASFGYFDDSTNETILRHIARRLRTGGRAVIDIYNREHMLNLPAEESAVRNGVQVATRRSWLGNRLQVQLAYESGTSDEFEWQLYTPDEFSTLCSAAGLQPVITCAWFIESLPPSREHARMQFVLERRDIS